MTQAENIEKALLKARNDFVVFNELQLKKIYDIYEQTALELDIMIRNYSGKGFRQNYLYGIRDSVQKEITYLRKKLSFQITNGMKNSVDFGLKTSMFDTYGLIQDQDKIKIGTSWIDKEYGIHRFDASLESYNESKWFSLNSKAVESAIRFSEQTNGLIFSENIWRNLAQTQKAIRSAVVRGLITGQSAESLSKTIEGFLHQPKKLFHRVKDKKGVLRLSKEAAEYHPGVGIYRNSYMNAMRLARTEYARAFSEGTIRYGQMKKFIKGFIWRTGGANPCQECLDLDGQYFPKSDPPSIPAHPNCECYLELSMEKK